MRRATRRYGRAEPVALTSLLDVTTILLAFALLVGGRGDAVDLPVAAAARPAEGAVEVTISARGVSLDGELVVALAPDGWIEAAQAPSEPLAALFDALSARAAALDAQGPRELLVRADRGLPFAVVRAVMITAGRAGFGQFRLVVAERRRRRRRSLAGNPSGSCVVRPRVLPGSGTLDYFRAGRSVGAEPPIAGSTRGSPKTMTRHQRNAARRGQPGDARTLGSVR